MLIKMKCIKMEMYQHYSLTSISVPYFQTLIPFTFESSFIPIIIFPVTFPSFSGLFIRFEEVDKDFEWSRGLFIHNVI